MRKAFVPVASVSATPPDPKKRPKSDPEWPGERRPTSWTDPRAIAGLVGDGDFQPPPTETDGFGTPPDLLSRCSNRLCWMHPE